MTPPRGEDRAHKPLSFQVLMAGVAGQGQCQSLSNSSSRILPDIPSLPLHTGVLNYTGRNQPVSSQTRLKPILLNTGEEGSRNYGNSSPFSLCRCSSHCSALFLLGVINPLPSGERSPLILWALRIMSEKMIKSRTLTTAVIQPCLARRFAAWVSHSPVIHCDSLFARRTAPPPPPSVPPSGDAGHQAGAHPWSIPFLVSRSLTSISAATSLHPTAQGFISPVLFSIANWMRSVFGKI